MDKFEILISNNSKSNYLLAVLKIALTELKLDISITKILKHDLESTIIIQRPALFMNDKLVFEGRVPAVKEIKAIIVGKGK